jgi:glutamyl-tRNA reductase
MQEVEHVRRIIAEEVSAFERWLRSLSVTGTISDLRQHVDDLRQQELLRTLRHLSSSLSERETATIQELTTRLTNKLLHIPMLRLKEAAAAGQGHIYAEALRYLFDLEEKTHETHNDRDTSQQTGNDTDPLGSPTIATALAYSGDNYPADSHER